MPHLPKDFLECWGLCSYRKQAVWSHFYKQAWVPQLHRMCLIKHRQKLHRQEICSLVGFAFISL